MASIRTLQTFLAAARLGSFAAAGQQVGLTAAAVGLQVRALETELGVALFDRSARAVVLNPEGRRRVPAVQELVGRWQQLQAQGQTKGDELGGTVIMGALVSALMGAFADALWTLKRQHPSLVVTLFAGQSAEFMARVERGELDAAVVTQPPAPLPSSLVWTPLYREPMVLIVPTRPHFALPAAPLQMLAQCPFMRFDRSTWTGHLVDEALAQCRATVVEGLELNSVEAIVELVRQGFGIAIVPMLANLQWRRDKALRVMPLPRLTVQRHVGLLERRSHGRQRFTQALKDHFRVRAKNTAGQRGAQLSDAAATRPG
ncbi:MAG: LysR family transcriptional regulator [Burkholderiaceae bacterium]|jgi:DNA-binding transcriptional LysR family regulator|nr:LysR family transcriptional regulator [Burkholderiaceae bacterium]MCU0964323.1 LysR family transcriptional regulator [Burkholderiaceae bacterium]